MNVSLHLKNFNDKVRTMNQTNGKNLTMTANEARNLQADIFELLTHCSALSQTLQSVNKAGNSTEITEMKLDGGGF